MGSGREEWKPSALRGARMTLLSGALAILVASMSAHAADLSGFHSPLGWDGRVVQPDGLYAVTLPVSWTVTPLDRRSVHASAPGGDSLFIYLTVAKKQFDTLDSLLDTLMELPKKKMKGFKEISRRDFTRDGYGGKTLQAEEDDGAWHKIFYLVVFTDTHQYLVRTGCRLDRFADLQPAMKKILDSFHVGPHQKWVRGNTYPIADPEGRYTAYVPPGWQVERREGVIKAQDASGRITFRVTVRDRSHPSLKESGAALGRSLKEQYPDHRVGEPMTLPASTVQKYAAKSVTMVTGGPEGDTMVRVYAIALNDRSEFLLEAMATGIQEDTFRSQGERLGSLVAIWQVYPQPD